MDGLPLSYQQRKDHDRYFKCLNEHHDDEFEEAKSAKADKRRYIKYFNDYREKPRNGKIWSCAIHGTYPVDILSKNDETQE